MATYTVTTTGDVVDPADGHLSLREALALADAATAADTIGFASAVQGDAIVLAGSQLTANSDVTIDGGIGVTIDGGERSRVLLVQGGTTDQPNDVTLRHLTFTGGRTTSDDDGGGGIRASNYVALTLDHATVSGNSTAGANAHGGGISGYNNLSLADSTVSGNSTGGALAGGGGIFGNYVTLTNSTVNGNSTAGTAADGGGISGGVVTLTSSTISNNSTSGADILDGHYLRSAHGGGVSGIDVTLTNSTVSGNSTSGDYALGGGIFGSQVRFGGSVTLTNSTVSGNITAGDHASGAGIFGRTVTLANGIIAGNAATHSTAPDVGSDFLVSNGHNISGSDVDGNLASDRENVVATLLFAAIDPATSGGLLADNGGSTPTIALRDAPDNPALGGADPADSPATDQRGVVRPQPEGSNPDIGAYELGTTEPQPPPVRR